MLRPRFSSRAFCISFLLLSQLAWILPFYFFVLIQTSSPTVIITEQVYNASRDVHDLSFAGPFHLLSEQDLSLLQKIYGDWGHLRPAIREKHVSKGFLEPAERTCFLWLPECYILAKHERILQIVKEAIGPSVLLYGITVWKGRNEALHRFHRDAALAGCKKCINFISGADVQLVSQSHKIPERLLQSMLRTLLQVEQESFSISNKHDQISFLESSFSSRIKKIVRKPDIWLENLEAEVGYGVFFHGGSVYRTEDVVGHGNTGLLLQFVSGDCGIRDKEGTQFWGSSGISQGLYMPPLLLVDGDSTELAAANDVKVKLIKDESLKLKLGSGEVRGDLLPSKVTSHCFHNLQKMQNITLFSGSNSMSPWKTKGIWRSRTVGEASTSVMEWAKIQQFLLGKGSLAMDFGVVGHDGEQVIVVLHEGLLYSRAVNDGEFYFYEMIEMGPGSAVLLSKKFMHSFVPSSLETAFISFTWAKHQSSPWNYVYEKIKGVKGLDNPEHEATLTTEGTTLVLSSGQAYDPDNNENCDVMLFMIDGDMLSILPADWTLQALDVLLIPANETCVLWNVGRRNVKFFALHICRYEDSRQIVTSVGASGKLF